MSRPKRSSPRDQEETPFSSILMQLCARTGALCAALVDREGETVDYAGRGDPFDIRILAAEWRLVLQHAGEAGFSAPELEMVVRARKKSFLVQALPEGYALVMQLARRSTGISERALSLAKRRLCEEAGFELSFGGRLDWTPVHVESQGNSKRPIRMLLGDQSQTVTVLGLIHDGVAERERSFRVRLGSGEERTLVREPMGHWYLEEDPF